QSERRTPTIQSKPVHLLGGSMTPNTMLYEDWLDIAAEVHLRSNRGHLGGERLGQYSERQHDRGCDTGFKHGTPHPLFIVVRNRGTILHSSSSIWHLLNFFQLPPRGRTFP